MAPINSKISNLLDSQSPYYSILKQFHQICVKNLFDLKFNSEDYHSATTSHTISKKKTITQGNYVPLLCSQLSINSCISSQILHTFLFFLYFLCIFYNSTLFYAFSFASQPWILLFSWVVLVDRMFSWGASHNKGLKRSLLLGLPISLCQIYDQSLGKDMLHPATTSIFTLTQLLTL